MKLQIVYPVLLSSLIFFLACNNNGLQDKQERDSLPLVEHNHESEKIELNNGQKWTVDSAMMVHLTKMQFYVTNFDKNQNKDYKTLASNLSESIDSLTSSCTMEGKAHDELHKWLVPYIELNDEFINSNDNFKSELLFLKIKNSFIEFNKYFE